MHGDGDTAEVCCWILYEEGWSWGTVHQNGGCSRYVIFALRSVHNQCNICCWNNATTSLIPVIVSAYKVDVMNEMHCIRSWAYSYTEFFIFLFFKSNLLFIFCSVIIWINSCLWLYFTVHVSSCCSQWHVETYSGSVLRCLNVVRLLQIHTTSSHASG